MKTKNTTLRRVWAGVAAVALGVTGAAAVGGAAMAAVGPDQPGAPTTGTLTINKYAGGHTTTPNPDDLLDGVQFTVTQVGRLSGTPEVCTAIDLTEAAGWDGLPELFASAPAAPASPFCLMTAEAQDDVTENGQVVFDLNVGIYFVQETDPGDNPIVSPVPDFYVSIPTSTGAGEDGWNYNVVADPKNQLMEGPTKTIEDQEDLVVGGEVTWTLSVPIPTLNGNDTFDTASMTDVLDSRLSYSSSTLTIGATSLVLGTHYNVDPNGVTWIFTEAGRAILDVNQGGTISVELVTTVDSVGDGSIPNDDYSSEFNGATVPGEPVPYTYWGQLRIQKNDNSRPVKGLEGAQFKVFLPNAQGTCAATAPTTGSIATGTSDVNGVVQWVGASPTNALGLWIANSDTPLPNPSKVYCVYETVVPAGHTAVPFPAAQTITPGTVTEANLTVVNDKTEGPELPLTGAAGTLAMTIGGLALVAIGGGAMLASRRRRSVEG